MRIYVKNKKLKEMILMEGHSLTAFSELVGISRTHLYNLLGMKISLSPDLARRIADALNVEITDIFEVRELEIAKEG